MRRREFLVLVGGALALRPRIACAQSRKVPTAAYLWHAANAAEEEPYFSAIREGFAKLGYIDGQNIKLVHRFPNEVPERFESMAAELVSMNVDVLMGGGIGAPYLKRATDKIPIVFMFVADPADIRSHLIHRPCVHELNSGRSYAFQSYHLKAVDPPVTPLGSGQGHRRNSASFVTNRQQP